MEDKAGDSSFNSQMVRLGVITVGLAIIANFIPVIYLWLWHGIIPPITDILKIWAVAMAAYGVSWVFQPLSFFAVLGTAGSYITWVSGNVASLKVPASIMAQKAADAEPGTPEGEIASVIGIAVSVFVSVGIVTLFVFIGAWVIPMLPNSVHKAFNYIIPAIFGALYVFLSEKDLKIGSSSMIAAIVITIGSGMLGIPGWAVGILVIAAGMLMAFGFYRMREKEQTTK
ncbi:MAG TPA: hypothetical protein VN631_04860 [Negativicutes bacterium]|nr:hypothetical protein [Negativicutes bacterium]